MEEPLASSESHREGTTITNLHIPNLINITPTEVCREDLDAVRFREVRGQGWKGRRGRLNKRGDGG